MKSLSSEEGETLQVHRSGWVWVASMGSSDLKPEEAHIFWKDTQKYWLETALGSRNTRTHAWQLIDIRTLSVRLRAHTPHPTSQLHCTHTHTPPNTPTTSMCGGACTVETRHLGSNPDSATDPGRLIHPTAYLSMK